VDVQKIPQFRIIYESAQDTPFENPDFKEYPQKYMELYTKNMDGSNINRITHNSVWEHQADVSPDGEKSCAASTYHLVVSQKQILDGRLQSLTLMVRP
jgi:hypothetical protein